jgi:5-methylcytosine-specific restriction protein B
VDFALRRRFAFVTLEPRFGDPMYRKWVRGRKMSEPLYQRIVQRMGALNEHIANDSRLGPSFRVGHSFFCPRGDDFSQLDDSWYRDIVDTEIAPLLLEYWHDEPETAKARTAELLA